MFALVALLAFYLGLRNIRKAFFLVPFAQWTYMNWILAVMGVALVAIGAACTWQALKDYKEAKTNAEEKEKEEKEKCQRQFFYDDEFKE